ncbi:MAG: DUF4124 domain-containing protein [Gammaproteobacteria bacterium]
MLANKIGPHCQQIFGGVVLRRRPAGLLLVMGLLMLSRAPLGAEIYTWQDAEGNTHFGDRPPAAAKTQRLEVKINTTASVAGDASPERGKREIKVSGRPAVIMYSASWCGVCDRAKQYFHDHRIAFKELDIEKSSAGRRGFAKLNGQGVPIILVGEKRMNGFDPARFEKLYRGVSP